MEMYEEIDKETMELLLGSLADRTLSGRQKLKCNCVFMPKRRWSCGRPKRC